MKLIGNCIKTVDNCETKQFFNPKIRAEIEISPMELANQLKEQGWTSDGDEDVGLELYLTPPKKCKECRYTILIKALHCPCCGEETESQFISKAPRGMFKE